MLDSYSPIITGFVVGIMVSIFIELTITINKFISKHFEIKYIRNLITSIKEEFDNFEGPEDGILDTNLAKFVIFKTIIYKLDLFLKFNIKYLERNRRFDLLVRIKELNNLVNMYSDKNPPPDKFYTQRFDDFKSLKWIGLKY